MKLLLALVFSLCSVHVRAAGLETAGAIASSFVFHASTAPKDNGLPVTYGVIINGDTEERHRLNAEEAVVFMKDHYKIKPKDIYTLSTRTSTKQSTLVNVVKLSIGLKQVVDGNDKVVIYMTGHGGTVGSATYLALADGKGITDASFAKFYLDNKAASTVFLADQCYSGGFAKAMTSNSAKKVVAVSSTDDANSTVCTFFIKPYMAAFADKANDTTPKNGEVSEYEAYVAAKKASVKDHTDHGYPKETANALYLTSGYVSASKGVGR